MKTMTKLGLAVTLLFLVSFFTQANAQSHNIRSLGCKYYKEAPNPGSGARVNGYEVCKVCSEKKEKERLAKVAENKRRNEILTAKLKAEAEAIEKSRAKAEEERLASEAAEKKRKEENVARLKQESESATRRANEIRGRYKELNNVQGNTYVKEIDGLKAYNDNEYYGVMFNEDILWRKPKDNMPIYLYKIAGMNYFEIYDRSKKLNNRKIYDMDGKTILVDGEEWVDRITYDSENNLLKVRILEEAYQTVSPDKLSMGPGDYKVEIYSTLGDLLAVHKANVEEDKAAWKKRYAGTTGAIFAMSYYLDAAKGTLIKTDTKFKVLGKQKGYLIK